MSQESKELVRRSFEALSRHDVDSAADMVAATSSTTARRTRVATVFARARLLVRAHSPTPPRRWRTSSRTETGSWRG